MPLCLPDLLAVLLLTLFVLLSLRGLDVIPQVYQDEGWIASPGLTYVEQGVFASDLFRGFFGSERHFYGFLPLYPVLCGASMKLFGVSLLSARLVSLLLASATLALTYVGGRRLLSPSHGLAALAVLALWPVAAPLPYLPTGIPLADLARLVRYDIGVPVFGLAGFLLIAGHTGITRTRAAAAGALAALSALCHVYGGAWLAVGAILVLRDDGAGRGARLAALCGSFVAVLSPWLLFAFRDSADLAGQNFNVSDRFTLFDPVFYLSNLRFEWRRYEPVLREARSGDLAVWIWGAAVVAGGMLLLRRAARERDQSASEILLALAVTAFLFALLVRPKTFSYLATLWPLLALTASTAVVSLLSSTRPRAVRAAAALLFAVPVVHGASAYWDRAREASRATPYPVLAERLRAIVPREARLLAHHEAWFALQGRVADYRSLQVPFSLSSRAHVPVPTTFARAADVTETDALLLDPSTLRFLEKSPESPDPGHAVPADVRAWMASRDARLVATLDDPSYGRFEVWRLSRPR
ncbi:MAG: hypothetical protein ACHQPI_12490 [Thermoanaerobaculia bacterium]